MLFASTTLVLAAIAAGTPSTVERTRLEFRTVDFSDQFNTTNATNHPGQGGFTGASTYPIGLQLLGGVPFELGPAHGPYAWNASNTGHEPNPRILEIDVDEPAVDVAYTLISSYWGLHEGSAIAVEFVGDDGAFARYELDSNDDVRDYNRNAVNRINHTTTIEVWTNAHARQRLDRQTFDLPDDFLDERLRRIRIVDTGDHGVSRAFVFGITLDARRPMAMPPLPAVAERCMVSDTSGVRLHTASVQPSSESLARRARSRWQTP